MNNVMDLNNRGAQAIGLKASIFASMTPALPGWLILRNFNGTAWHATYRLGIEAKSRGDRSRLLPGSFGVAIENFTFDVARPEYLRNIRNTG